MLFNESLSEITLTNGLYTMYYDICTEKKTWCNYEVQYAVISLLYSMRTCTYT